MPITAISNGFNFYSGDLTKMKTNPNKPSQRVKIMASVIALSLQPMISNSALSQGLEEVVVTAQKRTESLQDTPISMAAFTGDTLDRMGISSVIDIDKTVPNVVLNPFPASRTAVTAFIRGVGNVDLQITKDAAVGIYVDGVFLGRASGLATDIADLERVEVLRGPQGTLYGRNTTGGAINMITAKPEQTLGFKQKLSAGNRDYWSSQTSLNLPITEDLAARLSYMVSDEGGWVDNLGPGEDFSSDEKEAARLALRWLLSDDITVDYAWDSSRHTGGMAAYQITQSSAPAFAIYSDSSRMDKLSVNGDFGGIDDKVSGHALTLSWAASDSLELKSISSYREIDNSNYYDYGASVNYGNRQEVPGGVLRGFLPRGSEILDANASSSQWQLSQEFQAIGEAMNNRLEYVVGAYYFKEQGWDRQDPQNNVLALNLLQVGPQNPAYGLLVQATWTGFEVHAQSESQALYGQFTYTPDMLEDRLRVTLGLRYTEDERAARKTANVYDPGLFNPSQTGSLLGQWSEQGETDSSNFSPSLVLAYDLANSVNLYAKYSESYRAGGFNARSDQASFAQGFNPEELTAYELGIKSDLLDNRLRLNAAAFYYEYQDLQVDQNLPPNIGVTRTLNAGESEVSGFEMDLTAMLTNDLTLTLNYGYLDSQFKEFQDTADCEGNNLFGGATTDVSACREVPASPRHTYSVTAEYYFPGVSIGELSARVHYHWQDGSAFAVRGGYASRDSFGVVDASLQLSEVALGTGRLLARVWGRNLADEEYPIHAIGFGVFQLTQFNEPRSYGVDLSYEF